MSEKFELIENDSIEINGHKLYRIRALINFNNVNAGDLGGYVENEENLSQMDNCWIYDNACVYDIAKVYNNACVSDNARVFSNACVFGSAHISDDAIIKKYDDYIVFKNTWSSGRYFTYTKSNKMWRVGCFYGSGDELIQKAYKDSENSGKNYELCVNQVKEMEKIRR